MSENGYSVGVCAYNTCMDLTKSKCYQALKSRDARFDGRFFVGVKTTGVYCRPVCPARTPHIENVQFYRCAAEAEGAGFRPCLRCRPESSPGTPAWRGTSTTVSRALKLIDEGYLDEFGVEELSSQLGMTGRHLRRLFEDHLGVSPKAIAGTRRVLFAKQLITETRMPIREIALSSGYSSVRQFNTAFHKVYRKAPRDVRRATVVDGEGGLNLQLAYRPPYDWENMLEFCTRRALPGIEWVEDNQYLRTVCIQSATGVVAVSHDEKHKRLQLTISSSLTAHLPEVVARVRRQFDLGADPIAIASSLKSESVMAKCIRKRPGLRLPGTWDPFEVVIRAIIGQQISVAGARTLLGRLIDRYGEPYTADGRKLRLFPKPERLARARINGMGITGARIRTIRAVSQALVSRKLTIATGPALEEMAGQLREIPGIGPWTAQYIAMRALGEPDAFPTGDLGLIRAWEHLSGAEIDAKSLEALAERWRPWRAYAAMHLWATLNDKPKATKSKEK